MKMSNALSDDHDKTFKCSECGRPVSEDCAVEPSNEWYDERTDSVWSEPTEYICDECTEILFGT